MLSLWCWLGSAEIGRNTAVVLDCLQNVQAYLLYVINAVLDVCSRKSSTYFVSRLSAMRDGIAMLDQLINSPSMSRLANDGL